MEIVLIVVVALVIFALVPYLCRRVFDKGVDAIEHKINAKKNAENAGKEQNLSDRYK